MSQLQKTDQASGEASTTPTPADLVAQAKAAAATGTQEPAASQTPAGEQTPAGNTPDGGTPPADAGTTPNPAPDAAKDGAPTDPKELAAWQKNQIESANREAASYRVKLRDSEAEVARLKGLETENSTLKDQLTVAQVAIERADVVAEFNLPKDLAALLQGNTREELTKSAELLAKHIVPAGGGQTFRREPLGGLNPFQAGGAVDGKSAYEQAKSQR